MNDPILAAAAAHAKAAQALDHSLSGVTMSRATASDAKLAAPRMTAGLMNSGRAGIRYENSSSEALFENNEIHGNGKTERRGGVSIRDAQNATVRNNVSDGAGYTHNQTPDNVAVHASDSGRSDRKVDLNKRLIKRSAFLKMLGGMGVAMTPAARAFAYRGCATGSYYAQYYTGVNFDILEESRCEVAPLKKNWGIGKVTPLARADKVSARWTGHFNFSQSGEYEFTATADDGIRVYVDGERIIDEWRDQAATTFKARRQLTAGIHRVRVEYYERMYFARCAVDWALVSSPQIPSSEHALGAIIDTPHWPDFAQDIDAFNNKTGYVHPVQVTFDRFGEYGLNTGKMEVWDARGITPIWTWEPYNASLTSINAGYHDGWIDTQANLIASFPNTVVYVRFAHEMNGNWFPWGQQPAAYRSAFARVAQRVLSRAPNARMMWCPNEPWPTVTDYYPGDAYVDWLAWDAYDYDGTRNPEQVHAATYDIVAGINPAKPIAIAETACPEKADKANWITTLYADLVPNRMPRTKLVCWFDLNKERDWRTDSSQAALDAYRAVADRPEWGWEGGDPR